MHLILYNQVAQPDRLRVWIGATGRTAAPRIVWTLNGASADPRPPDQRRLCSG